MAERTTSIEQEERLLVSRVLKGDEAAQDELVRKHRERIYAVAVAFLGYQDAEAEDVVQETFAAAFQGLVKFEFRSSLYTWMNQICVRHCYKRIRVRSKTVLGLESGVAEALGHHTDSEEAAAGVIRAQENAWLRQAIAGMKALCRELLTQRDLQG
jgi:RNA polymerase sigma factor (sigma-70 family)